MTKPVYKKPDSDTSSYLKPISSGCKTPWVDVKFSTLVRPFYYPNSPQIPRYSITCLCDAEEHKEFLRGIQTIEKNEGAKTSVLKAESTRENGEYTKTGKYTIKFQSRDKIPVYLMQVEGEAVEMDLEDEFAAGEKIYIVYDIMRYTKKGTDEHGLSFKANAIYFYPRGE